MNEIRQRKPTTVNHPNIWKIVPSLLDFRNRAIWVILKSVHGSLQLHMPGSSLQNSKIQVRDRNVPRKSWPEWLWLYVKKKLILLLTQSYYFQLHQRWGIGDSSQVICSNQQRFRTGFEIRHFYLNPSSLAANIMRTLVVTYGLQRLQWDVFTLHNVLEIRDKPFQLRRIALKGSF